MKFFACLPVFLALGLHIIKAQEVHQDRTVTFTFKTIDAKAVAVTGDFGKTGPMTRNDAGEWSVTTAPLEPNIYSYKLSVDGQIVPDPQCHSFKPERVGVSNAFEVPGDTPAVWDSRPGIAHGAVQALEYPSSSLGITRHLRVYTPPGYDAAKEKKFPVLYLFHGSGDNEATWTDFGKAHLILDNLIAEGKARPMIAVMPDGHTAPPMPRDAPGAAEARAKNQGNFERDLLEDVIPYVEGHFRIQADRGSRAIIGLSMGGNQSLLIGLNRLDLFAWVGGMSSAVREPDTQLAPFFANAGTANEKLKLLWFGVGKDDFLLKDNQTLDAKLTEKQVKHTFVESAGAHAWPVWRRYLAEFAPLVFR
ncbi:MAG: putative esterase [Verrucomicrobiaceae bacterium]|nr:putative esterase [Verrucomicrobiaceae bacterium]